MIKDTATEVCFGHRIEFFEAGPSNDESKKRGTAG